MAIVYKDCDDVVIPPHVCDPCDNGEKGGIRSIALLDNVTFTNPSDPTEWTAGIEDGKIIVVPSTRGTFDGGSPVTGAGYGDVKETVTGYDFVLTARDPNYKQNGEFWAKVALKKNFKVAWRTETQVHISEAVVTITPKNAVEEDVSSIVDWQVEFKWFASKLSEPFDGTALKDEIFRCFEVTP